MGRQQPEQQQQPRRHRPLAPTVTAHARPPPRMPVKERPAADAAEAAAVADVGDDADERDFAHWDGADNMDYEDNEDGYGMFDEKDYEDDDAEDVEAHNADKRDGHAGNIHGTSAHMERLHRPIGPDDEFSLLIGCYLIINSNAFATFILLVIIANCALIAIEASAYQYHNLGWYLSFIDDIFLGLYVMEAALKLYVYRLDYFKQAKNNFDFFIFSSSMLYFLAKYAAQDLLSKGPNFVHLLKLTRALRAVRSLRAMRAISGLQSLQVLISTLTASIPAITAICSLGFLVLCIFAVLGRSIFYDIDNPVFSSIWMTAYWLFSLISLDSWTKLPRHVNGSLISSLSFFAALFVFLESFIILSLFTAAMCSVLKVRMQKQRVLNMQKSRFSLRRALKLMRRATNHLASQSQDNRQQSPCLSTAKEAQDKGADAPVNSKIPPLHVLKSLPTAFNAASKHLNSNGETCEQKKLKRAAEVFLMMLSGRKEPTFAETFSEASTNIKNRGQRYQSSLLHDMASFKSISSSINRSLAGTVRKRTFDVPPQPPGEIVLEYFGRDAIRGSGGPFADSLAMLENAPREDENAANGTSAQQETAPAPAPAMEPSPSSLRLLAKYAMHKHLRESQISDLDRNMTARLLASLEWGISDENELTYISDDLITILFADWNMMEQQLHPQRHGTGELKKRQRVAIPSGNRKAE